MTLIKGAGTGARTLSTEREGDFETRLMRINVGPQHPSTHGVLRLVVDLNGERIVGIKPQIGYLHTGFEKTMENRTYQQCVTYSNRMDYVNGFGHDLAYVLAAERLIGANVPVRAQRVRVILNELNRIASHLIFLGTGVLDIGALTPFFYTAREREQILDIFEMVSGVRMNYGYFRVGGLSYDTPDGFEAAVIHGNKSQNARQRALNGFRDGKVRILVATDIAARGIDVPGISHVVNFDLPDEAESYVHRIGRTGRNGADGIAVTLCAPDEAAKLRQVERIIRMKLPVAGNVLDQPDPVQAKPQGQSALRADAEGEAGRPRHMPGKAPRGGKPHGQAKPFQKRPAGGGRPFAEKQDGAARPAGAKDGQKRPFRGKRRPARGRAAA